MKKVILAKDIGKLLEKDRSFLNRSGITVMTARSSDEILALHAKEQTDLIITALDMPGMSSEELCSLIRNDPGLRSVSIIVVCAETPENLQRCTQCAANAFISSPVNSAVLLQEAYQLLHVTPRRSCRIPLKLNMEGSAKGKPFAGHAHNISASGMLFQSPAVFFEGDTIKCSFSLSGPAIITTNAEIVRVMKTGGPDTTDTLYGIRFSDLGEADVSALESYVGINTRTCSVR